MVSRRKRMACDDCDACELTLYSYIARFSDEEESIGLAIRHGLMARSVQCQRCGNRILLKKSRTSYVYHCQRRMNGGKCNFSLSARKNTFFANSMLPISKIMHFSLLWLLRKTRQREMMNALSMSSETVVDWSRYCREVCVQWMLERRNEIGGPGTVVEIDESKFGKRNMDRPVEGQWVFGGVQRGDNSRFFLVPVAQRNAETLISVIREWILPGTIIISDCWNDYDILEDEGFEDLKVNHSVELVTTGKDGYVHLTNIASMRGQKLSVYVNDVEMKWHSVKYSNPTFGKTKEHFEGHFAEYIFKQAYSKQYRMHHFLKAVATLYPAHEYKDVDAHNG